MPQGRLWERWGLSLILLLGFLLAIVGWQSFEELKGFWPGLAKHIFEAIAIATFIGLTVEQFLKKQFAKEVFFASVGYVLPEELRPEMRWLCELDDFCTQDTMRCTLTPIGTNSVRFHVHRTQVLKNIGAGTHDVKVGLGIDEWFREESPSRIKKLTILQKGNTWPPGDQLRSEHIGKIDCGLNIAGGNLKITLQKDEDATIISEFEECYPRNGYFHMLIKYPTSGARITVDCPDDIGMYLHFAHKERETLKGGNDYVCPFTLLPDQHVGIRFWDKQQNEKWKREPVTL